MKRNIILTTLLCLLILSSCEKYLDVKVSNGQVFITTANDCQLILDNYSVMNTNYPSDGQASSDDSFLNEVSYLNESVTAEDRAIYTWNANAIRLTASPQWRNAYFIIYNANLVLEALDKIKAEGTTSQATIDNLRGSALFFRSYCLWQTAQIYALGYDAATANQNPGIPIKLTSDINEVSVRGTVQQTYSHITAELEEAARLMNPTSSVASRPNKAAAYAMLARVYLSMGDYAKAQSNATAAIDIKGGLLNYNDATVNKSLTTNTPFTRFNVEVIFQSVMVSSLLTNPGAESTSFARVDPALLATFDDPNDWRKTVFLKQNKTNVEVSDPTQANPNNKRVVSIFDGTYRFTGNYEQSSSNMFNGLAVDELYLIRAECHARAGRRDEAMADLNTLLFNRWVTGTYINKTATDANDALAKILVERRKELMMRGQRWTDAKRMKLSLARDVKRIVGTATGIYSDTNNPVTYTVSWQYTPVSSYSLPAGDKRFALLIPNEVIINSSMAQNAR